MFQRNKTKKKLLLRYYNNNILLFLLPNPLEWVWVYLNKEMINAQLDYSLQSYSLAVCLPEQWHQYFLTKNGSVKGPVTTKAIKLCLGLSGDPNATTNICIVDVLKLDCFRQKRN